MNYCLNRVQQLYKKFMSDPHADDWDSYFNERINNEVRLIKYAEKLHSLSKADKTNVKWFMVTVRPKYEDVSFEVFKNDVEFYVNELPFIDLEYCFEQKGESLDDIGKGFHVHIIFSTEKKNYWQSHILRDIKRNKYGFLKYTKANCIQVDNIVCLQRAQEYIRGSKNDVSKELSCSFDEEWRNSLGLVGVVSLTRKN